LGANDGLVSIESLVVGVATAGSGRPKILIAGLAGLVAGVVRWRAGGPDPPGEVRRQLPHHLNSRRPRCSRCLGLNRAYSVDADTHQG